MEKILALLLLSAQRSLVACAGPIQLMPFCHEAYNALTMMQDAMEWMPTVKKLEDETWDVDHVVEKATKLMLDHGINEGVGIWMAHRHFTIEPGEKVFDKKIGSAYVTEPYNYTEYDAEANDTIAWTYMFSETPSGSFRLLPMDFVKADPIVKALHDSVLANEAFLYEYASLLKRYKLISVFGLNFKHRAESETYEYEIGERKLATYTFDPYLVHDPKSTITSFQVDQWVIPPVKRLPPKEPSKPPKCCSKPRPDPKKLPDVQDPRQDPVNAPLFAALK